MTPAPLRIGIDARAVVEERGGRGTMVRELLLALDRADTPHRFELFARTPWDVPLSPERFSWRLIDAPDPRWNVAAGLTAHRACDVYVSTNSYLTVWFTRVPSVMVVCDLVAYHDEYRPQRRAKLIEKATLPLAVRRATAITAISHATADDLGGRFATARAKTTVTLLAADERFARGDGPPAAEVLARHGLTKPYVLAVGTLEPRKNLPALIAAFAALPPAVRDAHELVLVGAIGWDTDETLAAVAQHRSLVRQLGHVPDEDLAALYRGAALFAYPSLYEGFGLPVLEAMAAGAPVLTSNLSSLPEVAGDAALYVDPRDVGSIAGGLERGLTDRDAAAALAARGRERAAAFSWDRHAREMLDVIERAAAARRT
jgi:glycosyltransferase involved in cell wall biosynthesis